MTNRAKANGPKLVPLKDQALAAIQAAGVKMVTQTRAGSARRMLMNGRIAAARASYRAGRYAEAITQARTA